MKCTATNRHGQPCKALAMKDGSGLCFAHNPRMKKKLAAARSLGGRNRRVKKPDSPIDLSDKQKRSPATTLEEAWSVYNSTLALENSVPRNRVLKDCLATICRLQEIAVMEHEIAEVKKQAGVK